MFEIQLPESLRRVLAAIERGGGRPLIVGGAVRDAAAGLQPTDFDLEVFGLEEPALAAALSTVGRVNPVGRSFGVLKVTTPGIEIDVSLPRRESKSGRGHKGFSVEPDPWMEPEDAAARRDYTINAMAYDPARGELLDFFHGLDDLKERVLRHTGPAFADDPLRVLRGMQFAGRFRLQAAPETIRLSQRLFEEAETLPIERIWVEWQKWAGRSSRPSAGLRFLRDCGWWEAYPELVALAGCPQDPRWHPEGDVWTHTLLVTDEASRIAIRGGLGDEERAVLVLSALCHDLGKPETTSRESGRVRSPGHTECVEPIQRFLERIGCPARLAQRAVGLSRHHLAHSGFAGSARHVRRLSRSLAERGETIEMLARLVEADHGGRPPLPAGLPDSMAAMLDVARELRAAAAAPRPLLQGRHLLELGVQRGPGMGKILRQAYEAQLDGAFDSLEGGLDWVRKEFSL